MGMSERIMNREERSQFFVAVFSHDIRKASARIEQINAALKTSLVSGDKNIAKANAEIALEEVRIEELTRAVKALERLESL